MRVIIDLEAGCHEEALTILETEGFMPAEDREVPKPEEGVVRVAGDIPDEKLAAIESVIGVLGYFTDGLRDDAPAGED